MFTSVFVWGVSGCIAAFRHSMNGFAIGLSLAGGFTLFLCKALISLNKCPNISEGRLCGLAERKRNHKNKEIASKNKQTKNKTHFRADKQESVLPWRVMGLSSTTN